MFHFRTVRYPTYDVCRRTVERANYQQRPHSNDIPMYDIQCFSEHSVGLLLSYIYPKSEKLLNQ